MNCCIVFCFVFCYRRAIVSLFAFIYIKVMPVSYQQPQNTINTSTLLQDKHTATLQGMFITKYVAAVIVIHLIMVEFKKAICF